MAFPCRCVNCSHDADGEDGKCHTCRERPLVPVECVFLSDEDYMKVLKEVHA